jgi:U3 small nucleolar RNA-associated protein 11
MPGNGDEADRQRIDRLRRELEASSPQSGDGDWDAAAELAEVEKLAAMGIVLKPRDESSSSRKGKGKAAPSGHVIFVDGREECESPTLTGRSITNLQSSNGRM